MKRINQVMSPARWPARVRVTSDAYGPGIKRGDLLALDADGINYTGPGGAVFGLFVAGRRADFAPAPAVAVLS